MTLKQLIEEWLYENHKSKIKVRTLLRYETILRNNLYPLYGDTDIKDITPRVLQHWLNEIKEKVSPF